MLIVGDKKQSRWLKDGVYFSTVKPEVYEQDYRGESTIIVGEDDYYLIPYECTQMYVFRGHKPQELNVIAGQGNYGTDLLFEVKEAGYVIVGFQND
jgi:hypothetical protein